MVRDDASAVGTRPVAIPIDGLTLAGELSVPAGARGLVIFAHGSGSSRLSPRNRYVAHALQDDGLATLLLDLLTAEEERLDERTRALRFDIPLLASRLEAATTWALGEPVIGALPIGYFGASTGAAAALIAAAHRPSEIRAVVSRGGRPDLAGPTLRRVHAPTLLIVGGDDDVVLRLNKQALGELSGQKALQVVPGATHLFEEPGALEDVTRRARAWFDRHLRPKRERIPDDAW
ncbi:MAG TPA: hypothetical protein VF041_19750 [Gemmatimonadaceae bacterium]